MSNEPRISTRKSLSPIWFIPLLALLIAGWLAFNAWQAAGPLIEIEFNDAAGITVEKTHVRYRDVDIGTVKKIRLSDDFKTVRVSVEMEAHVAPLITDQSNFWVVSPRVSRSGVSGIETLLSGVYIEMDPGDGNEGQPLFKFEGLEEPPSVRSYDEGSSYQLIAESLDSLDIGSPVYHRQVPVGEVTGYKLLAEQGKVQIRIFVKKPYNQLVKARSQFWNVSGFGANIGLDGVELNIGTLSSLIAGGVEFDNSPDLLGTSEPANTDASFYLFADRDAVSEGAITVSYPFLLRFSGSVRGLKAGAPVEYLGIQVGQVEHIALDHSAGQGQNINVIIAIQPERMSSQEVPDQARVLEDMTELVRAGMQARLNSGSLLGGSLFVDLVPGAGEGAEIVQMGNYPELPTSENEYSQITRKLASIVERVQQIPFDEIGVDLQGSLKGLNRVVDELKQAKLGDKAGVIMDNLNQATDGLDGTVAQLEQTLRAIDQTVSPDSSLTHTLTEALDDISDAAKSMEQLTDELYRYPNALLQGKEAAPNE
ncbi:MAG: intermembrane transport protein PqiB [Pontibacterium sp.]